MFQKEIYLQTVVFSILMLRFGGVGGCICFIFKYVDESLVVPYTLSPKLGFWDARFVDVTHYFIYFSEAGLAGDLSFVYIDTLGFRHH